MISKRLLRMGAESKKYIYRVVACQWGALLLQIALIFRVGWQLQRLSEGVKNFYELGVTAVVFVIVIALRAMLRGASAQQASLAAGSVKATLRPLLYEKLLRLGTAYSERISTAEAVQVSTEGIDQLETYFGSYLPQLFYCALAPLTLFVVLAPIDVRAALVLFVCVPLIPLSIIAVQKFAKKLLAKYWGLYTAMGDDFLENLQGMTTLKIYGADERFHARMNQSAERFRVITMKVLSMQLSSILLMDAVAYGGAAAGAVLAVTALVRGSAAVSGAIAIVLLSAEFFLPLRALGSLFHIAMNGMAAAEKMFCILDEPEQRNSGEQLLGHALSITLEHVCFAYPNREPVLRDISFVVQTGMTALVGVSGCGKSTLAALLTGRKTGYQGSICIGGVELRDIARDVLRRRVTSVGDRGYLFGGTVRENLQMAKPNATDAELRTVLERTRLWSFLGERNGLDTVLREGGTNLSGGQRQRLNLARALLHDSAIYIFDEVTSNIDVESEDAIMQVIHTLAQTKTVLVISHRLQNIVHASQIMMLQDGVIAEQGTHQSLRQEHGPYMRLYTEQIGLEQEGIA